MSGFGQLSSPRFALPDRRLGAKLQASDSLNHQHISGDYDAPSTGVETVLSQRSHSKALGVRATPDLSLLGRRSPEQVMKSKEFKSPFGSERSFKSPFSDLASDPVLHGSTNLPTTNGELVDIAGNESFSLDGPIKFGMVKGPQPKSISHASFARHRSSATSNADTNTKRNAKRLTDELKKEQLKHSARSNPASRLKATRLNTVKMEPGRPVSCPVLTCQYNKRGLTRKHDRIPHTVVHFIGCYISCEFCAPIEAFEDVDAFKQHLTYQHGAKDFHYSDRMRSLDSSSTKSPGACSICHTWLANAQESFDHIDMCVARAVERAQGGEFLDPQQPYTVSDNYERLYPGMYSQAAQAVAQAKAEVSAEEAQRQRQELTRQKLDHDDEDPLCSMYMHYTISEDRCGDQDSVMAQRLAALGGQSREIKIRERSDSFYNPGERRDENDEPRRPREAVQKPSHLEAASISPSGLRVQWGEGQGRERAYMLNNNIWSLLLFRARLRLLIPVLGIGCNQWKGFGRARLILTTFAVSSVPRRITKCYSSNRKRSDLG